MTRPGSLLRGGGIALGVAGAAAVALLAARPRRAPGARLRVVVLGAGFGGLAAATRLAADRRIDLTVIDCHEHHLFQPLLYQVATAALSPSDIARPVRQILPARPGLRVVMARVTGIDAAARVVRCGEGGSGFEAGYDELIVATGSRPSYFGHGDWAAAAPGLKTLDDAVALRSSMLEAFERAALATGAERTRLLTFVLIGGGPTGVEMAGAIAALADDLRRRQADQGAARARIVLVEAGDRVLSSFAPELSAYAAATLAGMGVELRTAVKVTGIDAGRVTVGAETIEAGTVIWTAGTEATPVAAWLGVEAGHGGQVAVGPDLRLPGHREIAVIGDAAHVAGPDGRALPGLAPVAKQQGRYVSRSIKRRLRGGRKLGRFRYRDYGALATIGRDRAVAELGDVKLAGRVAWVVWAVAHIVFLIGFRNRFMVTAQWAFAYFSDARPGQLIVRPPRATIS